MGGDLVLLRKRVEKYTIIVDLPVVDAGTSICLLNMCCPSKFSSSHLLWTPACPSNKAEKRIRYKSEFGLSEADVASLTDDQFVALYFEETAQAGGDPVEACKWIIGDIAGYLNRCGGRTFSEPVVIIRAAPWRHCCDGASAFRGTLCYLLLGEICGRFTMVTASSLCPTRTVRQVGKAGCSQRIASP